MTTADRQTWTLDDWGKLILRVSIGGLMLFHGVHKVFAGVGGIAGMLEQSGLPRFFSVGIYVGEVIAPLMILVGFYARLAGGTVVFNMAVAIFLAHSSDMLALGEHGGWAIELPMLYLLGSLAIVLLGAGRITVLKGQSNQ
jgi:putative oxidoreductase